MYYIKRYPVTLFVVLAIGYLSFFTPPKTGLDTLPYIDKVVHLCMYGGLTTVIWTEYLLRHPSIGRIKLLVGGALLPALMSGCIEILQATCTENRSGDWLDFLANCTGVALGCALSYFFIRPFLRRHPLHI